MVLTCDAWDQRKVSPHAVSAECKSPPSCARLSPCHELAYRQYHEAIRINGPMTDLAAYAWHAARHPMPDRATWARYLRRGRKYFGTCKDAKKRTMRTNGRCGQADNADK
jgi:hypothetical protein